MCWSLFFNKEEALRQVFSCEFYKNFKNIFFKEHLSKTACEYRIIKCTSREVYT